MNWAEIGKRIRQHREFLGYTRETFAEKIDVTPKFCSDIELGIKGMSVSTLCRISNVLNLSVDYVLFGKEDVTLDSPAINMLNNCPKEKLPFLENIIGLFMKAIEKDVEI